MADETIDVDGGGTAEKTVPYSRFATVNQQNKTLSEQVATLTAQLEERETAGETAFSDLEKQVAELTAGLAQRDYELARQQAVSAAGLTAEQAEFVVGDTAEALQASAAKLAQLFQSVTPSDSDGGGAEIPPHGGKPAVIDMSDPAAIRKNRKSVLAQS